MQLIFHFGHDVHRSSNFCKIIFCDKCNEIVVICHDQILDKIVVFKSVLHSFGTYALTPKNNNITYIAKY